MKIIKSQSHKVAKSQSRDVSMIPKTLTNIDTSNEIKSQSHKVAKSQSRDVSMIPKTLTNIDASNEVKSPSLQVETYQRYQRK